MSTTTTCPSAVAPKTPLQPTVPAGDSLSFNSDDENDPTWSDWNEETHTPENDTEETLVRCLFCADTFSTPSDLFAHCNTVHDFDWHRVTTQGTARSLTSQIQLINYCRTMTRDGSQVTTQDVLTSSQLYEQPEFYTPVLANDVLLYSLECESDSEDDCETETEKAKRPLMTRGEKNPQDLSEQPDAEPCALKDMQAKLDQATSLLKDMVMKDEETLAIKDDADIDKYYFESYSSTSIHREMLSDRVRTDTYEAAIVKFAHVFKDKIVLDVGCGTGILSLFAARAGAKHVFGVDSSAIAPVATQIVADNGYSNTITILCGKIETLELPGIGPGQVDIILSEWMGYCLLYESMLDSVLFARDKWLAPNGLLFPDKARMYLQGITDLDAKKEFWHSVYGFDMSAVAPKVCVTEPFVQIIHAEAVLSNRALLHTIDIPSVTYENLNFTTPFTLDMTKDGTLHGLVSSFDIDFCGDRSLSPVSFSTGVEVTPTHWQQVFFYFPSPLQVTVGTQVTGMWELRRNALNQRFIDVDLTWCCDGVTSFQRYKIQ